MKRSAPLFEFEEILEILEQWVWCEKLFFGTFIDILFYLTI